jgi:hypothetical protein
MDDRTLAFLTQECDRLLNLYARAQDGAQNVFNFYLTFVTTVVGGLIFIGQADLDDARLTAGGVLLFAAVVGSVYLSALSGRYAHAARYAQAVDAIRRHLLRDINAPLPGIYSVFLNDDDNDDGVGQRPLPWYIWLMPTGTYQMFIAIVNAAALAAMTALVFSAAEAGSGRGLTAVVIVFLLALTVYNTYSRLVVVRFVQQLGVRIDMGRALVTWAARD